MPVWGDGIEIMSKSPGGHGEARLDRRGHIIIVLGKLAPQRGSREYDGVDWGSVLSGGPLWKCSPQHTPGSRRVPKSPCTPFPCLCRQSTCRWDLSVGSRGAGLCRSSSLSRGHWRRRQDSSSVRLAETVASRGIAARPPEPVVCVGRRLSVVVGLARTVASRGVAARYPSDYFVS